MALTAPVTESTYELTPEGTHAAILYKIINLGTYDTEWQGRQKKTPLIRLMWELPNEMKEFEVEENGEKKMVKKPFAIGRELTFSMSEKANLRKIVTGMVGKSMTDEEAAAFDLETLLGKACLVNVVHETSKSSGNKYALLSSTQPMMKGMEVPAQFNESEVLDVNDLSEEQINELPSWLADKMRASDEYKKKNNQPVVASPDPTDELDPNDVPF